MKRSMILWIALSATLGCEPSSNSVTSQAVAPTSPTTEQDTLKPGAPRSPTKPKEALKAPPKEVKKAAAPSAAAKIWGDLNQTQDTCKDVFKWWFDYWPNGGMRAIACHLAGAPSLKDAASKIGTPRAIFDALTKASPVPIYLQPKGQPSWGDEGAHGTFARYNPEFVTWFIDNAIPGAKDPVLRAATQGPYDKFFREQALVFDEAYQRIAERPKCFAKQKKAYLRAIKKKKAFDRDVWVIWQADNFCDGVSWAKATYSKDRQKIDPNLTRDAVGFWIRRHEDGTAALWHKGLERLRQTYE